MTRSEYISTLPLWRRLLATFNWRPVYDIEQETEMLKRESEHLKKQAVQVEIVNSRLAALESRLDALLRNADSSPQTPPATGSN